MSKKLSQSEIDALVASLLAGDAPPEEQPPVPTPPPENPEQTPAQPIGITAEMAALFAAAPSEPPTTAPAQPAPEPAPQPEPELAAAAPAPAGLPPESTPFELLADLGQISQAEVDAVIQAFKGMTADHREPSQAAAPGEPPKEAAPAAAAAMAPEIPTAPVPREPQQPPAPQDPPMAQDAPASAMAIPPSNESYAASKAEAAEQTRKALSIAALSGVLMDIELILAVELGRARLTLGDVLSLGPGSVITLEKLANTPVDVLVNRVPLMKGEVLAIGEKYGIRITKSSLKQRAVS